MLGLTAVVIAWVSWVAATHAGGQSLSFTKCNNLAAEGNSKWNEASQKLSTEWATGINNALVSPFSDEEFVDSYFTAAR